MTSPKMDSTAEEMATIMQIVQRAAEAGHYPINNLIGCAMDLDAAHSNGCPLDFDKLLAFSDFDFAHDVNGIRDNIDRQTGKLGNQFLPQSALTIAEANELKAARNA